MQSLLIAIIGILCESAIYLLLGFALAGALHVVLRRTPRFAELLARKGSRSVALAALLGAPIPLCSCGVVPAAMTLRKRGASKGATVSFLISCPETDVVSILLTYGLLGPVMAIFRPLAAIITAMVAGRLTDLADRGTSPEVPKDSCADHGCDEDEEDEYNPEKGPLWNAVDYGFVRFFDDIIGSLLLGVVLGGVITVLLPSFGLAGLGRGSTFIAMLVMLVIGIPMYVCASASTPIAAGLVASGLSPGTALVFLLAGPATNIGSLLVLVKYLGKRVLVIYLSVIAVVSVLMGLWLDAAFARAAFTLPSIRALTGEAGYSPLEIAGAIVLAVLICLSLRRRRVFDAAVRRFNRTLGLSLAPAAGKTIALVLLVLLYLASGLCIVGPGERAVGTRFGRITEPGLGPGLHYHWPYPMGRVDVVPAGKIERLELGFSPFREATDPSAESWMLTGRADIVDVTWVVQYRVGDSAEDLQRYLYGVAEPRSLVRSAADSAIRLAIGQRDIDTLLTTDRGGVEAAVAKSLQAALDECRTGLYVVNVGLVDVHAPPEVHWAFRDVASAAEDKAKVINEADEYRERVVPEAQAKHETQALAAQASAVEAVRQAEGRGAAFVARLSAYRENPAVTRTRLYLESMDTVLPALSKYVALSEAVDRAIDLWWVRQSGGPAAGSGPNGDWLRGQAGELGGPRGGRDGGSP